MRDAFQKHMVIRFSVGDVDSKWNLQMARIIHLLWEVCQASALQQPFCYVIGEHSTYVTLADYRISGTITI